jgi:hypothetical protein
VDLTHSRLTHWFTSGECVQYLHQETCPRAALRNRSGRTHALMNANPRAATLAHPRETAVLTRYSKMQKRSSFPYDTP